MTEPTEHSVAFDSTEGLLYRALCVLIDQSAGHLVLSWDDMEMVTGRFMLHADDQGLTLTTLRGETDSEH